MQWYCTHGGPDWDAEENILLAQLQHSVSSMFKVNFVVHTYFFYIFLYSRYYTDIYNQSGFAEQAKQYGSWFTWSESPRAKIFARNHTDVVDMTSMMELMRYMYLYVCVHTITVHVRLSPYTHVVDSIFQVSRIRSIIHTSLHWGKPIEHNKHMNMSATCIVALL